jgi:protein ImuB
MAALQLPGPVEEAEALLFAARRLLYDLTGFLAATGQGAQHLRFHLTHEGHDATCLELELAMATRDPGHLAAVLRERLQRVALPAPTLSIALESLLLLPLAANSHALLPNARGQSETAGRLVERLRARLGNEALKGLTVSADHRPERAWRMVEVGTEPVAVPPLPRPLWLLSIPRRLREIAAVPHHDGPLALLAGPERIESGWWDGADVTRDYFVARDPSAALLWIYRDCHENGGWYLHGYFA